MRLYTVLEYKSPQDRMTWEDFDQGRGYAILCKRKYHLRGDRDVAVIFLASAVSKEFYEVASHNGHLFEEGDKGIGRCQVKGPGGSLGITYYVVNLLELGKEYPESLLNLLSAREHARDQRGDRGRGRTAASVHGQPHAGGAA